MSTSLSRQLEQLKASQPTTVTTSWTTSGVFSSGPFILDHVDQLDAKQLEVLAMDSFEKLRQENDLLRQFGSKIFDMDDQEEKMETDADSQMEWDWQEQFLYCLTPNVLDRKAQIVLQWLMSSQKIHVSHPEAFFWTGLPYYEYKIFHKMVEALAHIPLNKYPKWFKHFKDQCHPATQRGMLKLLASDAGFFSLFCDFMLRTRQHQVKFRDANYNNVIFCFCSSVIGSMNLSSILGERQAHSIMQVIFQGLKADHDEFFAMGATLLANVFPRVDLKPKVVKRAMKVIEKCCKRRGHNENTLSLMLIVYRTQKSALKEDQEFVLKLLLSHEEVLNSILQTTGKDFEDLDYAKRVMRNLVLMVQDAQGPKQPLILNLLGILRKGLAKHLLPDDCAIATIKSISKLHKQCEELKQKDKKIAKALSKETRRSLALLKKSHPVEYLEHSLVQTEDIDILVLHHTDVGRMPTVQEITVKKILLNNEAVCKARKEFNVSLDAKEIKTNADSVKHMYRMVAPEFLLKQLEVEELAKLTFNFLNSFGRKAKVLTPIVKFLCSQDVQSNEGFKSALEDEGISLSCTLTPFLFLLDEKEKKTLPILKNAEYLQNGIIAKALSEKFSTEYEIDSINQQCWLNLKKNITIEDMETLATDMKNSQVNVNPTLIALLMRLCLIQKSKLEKVSDLILTLIDLVKNHVRYTYGENEMSPNDISVITKCRQKDGVMLELLLEGIKFIKKNLKSNTSIGTTCLQLSRKWKSDAKGDQVVSEKFFECHLALIGDGENYENYAADFITNENEDLEVKTKCLQHLNSNLSQAAKKRILGAKSVCIPSLLACLMSDKLNKKMKKIIFSIFKSCSETPPAGPKLKYLPLIAFLQENKKEFLNSDLDSLNRLMNRFIAEDKSNDGVLSHLLRHVTKSCEMDIFTHLAALFTPLNETQSELTHLAQFGSSLLDQLENETKSQRALAKVFSLFLPSMMKHLNIKACWEFFSNAINHDGKMTLNNINQFVSVVALRSVQDLDLTHLEKGFNKKLFETLIDLGGQEGKSEDILFETRKVIDSLSLTGDMFKSKLEEIWVDFGLDKDVPTPKSRRKETPSWNKTLFLVEMQSGRQYPNSGTLLKPFFNLLRFCSNVQKDQSDPESNAEEENAYAVNLILSSIQEIMERLSQNDLEKFGSGVFDNTKNPGFLVELIRTNPNPETKSTALIILALSSSFNADFVLQNSLPLFTFMGNHFLLKMDSEKSFQVACKAIDTLVPHMKSVCEKKGAKAVSDMSLDILTTFVDASVDMPTHRFKTFLHRLVVCLGERENLWILTLQLLKKTKKKTDKDKSKMTGKEKMQQILDLYSEFSVRAQVEALLWMLVNLSKDDCQEVKNKLKITKESEQKANEEFDLLRLKMLIFVSSLLTSNSFSNLVMESLINGENLTQELGLLVESSILNLDAYEKTSKSSKVYHHLLQYCERVLEGSLSILPTATFVQLLQNLLQNKSQVVKRKSLEILNAKLQQQDESLLSEQTLPTILEPLTKLSLKESSNDDVSTTQQLALLALRSFARALARHYPNEFKAVCVEMTKKEFLNQMDGSRNAGNTAAAAVLCLSEMFLAIGPHAVACIPKYVKWILELFKSDFNDKSHVLVNSLILASQKLLENFIGFLNPYLMDFTTSACRLTSSPRSKSLLSTLANTIPSRSLINIASQCMEQMEENPLEIMALLVILKENFGKLDKSEAMAVCSPFMDFFMHAFKYRLRTNNEDSEEVTKVEYEIIDTFLALTLKLSLEDFKPQYYKVFNLCFNLDSTFDPKVILTAYHVTLEVAKKLKALFDFHCESLVQKTTTVLTHFADRDFEGIKDEDLGMEMLSFVLDSLSVVFEFNRVENILTANYEDHVNSVLKFFEMEIEDEDHWDTFSQKMTNCLANLASTTEDETQWRYLHYQTLLCLRSPLSQVRHCILSVLTRFVECKGESYMSVLPEAVPFLSETLEDEEAELEDACRKLIAKMEETFGQSVQSYFEY